MSAPVDVLAVMDDASLTLRLGCDREDMRAARAAVGELIEVNRARLIAHAPDLLTAAQALGCMPEGFCFCSQNRIGDDSKVHEPECRDMRAAIAKATGARHD